MVNRQIDIGIITVIEEEFLAVLGEFGDPIEIVSGRREYNLHRAEGYDVAVVRCLKQGNAEAQSVAHDIIADLAPQWLVVVGIAGGAATTDFTLGDVIISSHVYDFSVEAALQDGVREFSLDGGPLHRGAGPKVANLKARQPDLEGWNAFERLGMERPTVTNTHGVLYGTKRMRAKVRSVLEHHFGGAARPPLFKAGHIASSDRLLKDTELLAVWQRCARHIAAIEMESAGVAKAAHGHDIPFVAIRGISDIVGLKRSPAWTEYASRTAAAFARAFLRTRPCQPRRSTFGTNLSGVYAAKAPITPTATVSDSMDMQPVSRDQGDKSALVLELDPHALPVLPSDHIPEPAPLPRGSRMNMASNAQFVGRMSELSELAKALQVGKMAVTGQIAAATGLGGIGKTQLAAAFVHRYGQFFSGGVFWLSFADPATVPAEVALCGGPGYLGLWPADATPNIKTQLLMVRVAWAEPVPRLLVFDNCEDEKLLNEWRPASGGCRVLVTCRRPGFSAHLGVYSLPLDILQRSESLTLLRSFGIARSAEPADELALDAICAELGDLPLALHLAGSFLARYRSAIKPADYLVQLREQPLLGHKSLQGLGAENSPTGHELHVGRTFALSWNRLDPTDAVDAAALALMQIAAYLAPGEPIPRALLIAPVNRSQDDTAVMLVLEEALHRLLDLGLLDASEPGSYTIHRLVTAFVQQTISDHATICAAVEWALLCEISRVNASGYPMQLLRWQPHLFFVIGAATVREDMLAANLCHTLSYHLHTLGDHDSARTYCEHALAIYEKQLGPDHPTVAGSLNNLARMLDAQGALTEAQPLYERALTIFETQLGPDHPQTATGLNNLALLLDARGEYAKARPLFERALAIREMQFGPDDPYTATSLHNLAGLLHEQQQYTEARPLYERALAIREKQLGSHHPHTAGTLDSLGELLRAQGEYDEARRLLERALAIRQERLGAEHPDTALSLSNLGFFFQTSNDGAKAWALYERALAIRETRLGPEHPETAMTLSNMAFLLKDQGEYAKALGLFKRTLAISEMHLGSDNPRTAIALFNVGSLLHAQGAQAEALPLLKRALAICEAQLGSDHPQTRRVRDTVALASSWP